jgi:nucleoid DNA-binding protein
MLGKQKVTKNQLVRSIYYEQDMERLGITQLFVLQEVVDIFLENIADAIVEGEPVYLRGFCTFNPIRNCLYKKMCYAPKTKKWAERLILRHQSVFRASPKLIKRVNIGAKDVFQRYFDNSNYS